MGVLGVVDEIYEVVDRTTKECDLQVGEKLVVRLWNWSVDRLIKDAETDHKIAHDLGIDRPYEYSISTFGLARDENETVAALNDRLIAYVRTKRRSRYYCLITESELTAGGFELILS